MAKARFLLVLCCVVIIDTAVSQNVCSGLNNGPRKTNSTKSSCSGVFFDIAQTWQIDCVKIPGGCPITKYDTISVTVAAPTGGCLSETPTVNCGPVFYSPTTIYSGEGNTHRMQVDYQKKKIIRLPIPFKQFCVNDGPRMRGDGGCAHQTRCPCESGGGSGGGGGGGFEDPCDGVEGTDHSGGECDTPIIIASRGQRIELTDSANGVDFDLNADGVAERLSWTVPDTDDAFLALDRNGNGFIDDGTELFGNYTSQPPSEMPNGFLALAVFDLAENGGNHDDSISPDDEVFSSLWLWYDRNHDGVSQASELLPLSGRVNSISLDYRESKRRDRFGNLFRYISVVGLPGRGRTRAIDVILRRER